MTLTLRNTRQDKPPPLRVGIYGDSGVGKTTFAGSFPKPFFFSMGAEVGISSLTQLDQAADYVLINSVADMMEGLEMFEKNYKGPDGKHRWRTAVIDTATVYGRFCTMQESYYGTEKIEYTQWMKILGHFLNIRDVLHRCDCHVVWVFHCDDIKSGDVVLRRGPKLVGQAKAEILQTCGLLCYLEKTDKLVPEERNPDGSLKTEAKVDVVRKLWVRCLEGTVPAFETKSWYEQVLTHPCYQPTFEKLSSYLAPKDGRQHIAV